MKKISKQNILKLKTFYFITFTDVHSNRLLAIKISYQIQLQIPTYFQFCTVLFSLLSLLVKF